MSRILALQTLSAERTYHDGAAMDSDYSIACSSQSSRCAENQV